MTDWKDFARALIGTWPTAKWDEELITAYCAEIETRGVSPEEALAALRGSSSDFPLAAGAIAAAVERRRQGAPPGWLEAYKLIRARVTTLPYHAPETGMRALVERLAADGHETVARFVAGMSAADLRALPDPAYHQDTAGSMALSRAEREYRKAVEDWRADPRPGMALEMVDGVSRRALAGGMAGVVERLRPAPRLESGE